MSFSDYVQKQEMSTVELPLIHTTECFHFASIQASHQINTSFCNTFKEPLLYTFYGRPAYRDHSRVLPVTDVSFYPVCFVFKPGAVFCHAKRVFPFDTGASQNGLYEPAVKATNALAAYELFATAETARRIVRCFFEVDQQYLSNKPKDGMTFDPGEPDVLSYYQLIRGSRAAECDDRCSAIEVQIADNLDLRGQILMAVVLPTHFLDDALLRRTIVTVWKAQPLTYYADLGMRPLEFHGAVRQLVRQFYDESSVI